MALGRVVLPRRAIVASSAREGSKSKEDDNATYLAKSLKKLTLDKILVVD